MKALLALTLLSSIAGASNLPDCNDLWEWGSTGEFVYNSAPDSKCLDQESDGEPTQTQLRDYLEDAEENL